MELLAVVGIIASLVVLYFFLGVALKFLWGWWILVLGAPACLYVGLAFGWLGAVGGVLGFCVAIFGNNEWHDSPIYLAISGKLDKAFYFKDT